ncbi:MAG: hypothetical protein ACREAA_03675 [Candidatus Polarisedimenticolia bacterium]
MDSIPLWALFPLTVLLVLLSMEAGYRVGRWRRASGVEKEAPVGAMVGATLALLAFMLAFSFGMAASHYDDRKEVFLHEVNAIEAAYLRAELLPQPQRTAARGMLKEYVDVRLEGFVSVDIRHAIRRSEELQAQLWSQAVETVQGPHWYAAGLFIQSLNQVIDLHTARVTAKLRERIPGILWLVLYGITIAGMASMGYQAGLAGTGRSIAALALAFTFSAVMYLIADLDRPGTGMILVDKQAMIDLRESMERP